MGFVSIIETFQLNGTFVVLDPNQGHTPLIKGMKEFSGSISQSVSIYFGLKVVISQKCDNFRETDGF